MSNRVNLDNSSGKSLGFQTIFGTSVRRSSRSAFGRSTGNDVSGHYKRHYFFSFFSFVSFFFSYFSYFSSFSYFLSFSFIFLFFFFSFSFLFSFFLLFLHKNSFIIHSFVHSKKLELIFKFSYIVYTVHQVFLTTYF